MSTLIFVNKHWRWAILGPLLPKSGLEKGAVDLRQNRRGLYGPGVSQVAVARGRAESPSRGTKI